MAGTGEEERLPPSYAAATTVAAAAATETAPTEISSPGVETPPPGAVSSPAAETSSPGAETSAGAVSSPGAVTSPATETTPHGAVTSPAAETSSPSAEISSPAAETTSTSATASAVASPVPAPAAAPVITEPPTTAHITEVPSAIIDADSPLPVDDDTTPDVEDTDDVVSVASDDDSAVGSLSYQSLVSLTDSIREFRHENGRTYHSLSAGKYWCPNDDPENSRLDLQHHAHRLTFEGDLCCCPKKAGAKVVLDLGTGTGIWAMEYADEHPEAVVIGVDLSPIQPEFVPPNCQFEVDDIEKEWTWSQDFDFIWWRALLGCFVDTKAIIQKCFDNLESGGYLEMHDGTFPLECDDGTMPADCALLRLALLAKEGSSRLGRPLNVSPHYAKMMEEVGFEDIVFQKYKWPTNPWPREPRMKRLGHWSLANVEPGLEGLHLALLTRGMGMTVEETMVLCAEARKDLKNPNIHAYWPVYYCYGRKP